MSKRIPKSKILFIGKLRKHLFKNKDKDKKYTRKLKKLKTPLQKGQSKILKNKPKLILHLYLFKIKKHKNKKSLGKKIYKKLQSQAKKLKQKY
jgi:hypothetical protein